MGHIKRIDEMDASDARRMEAYGKEVWDAVMLGDCDGLAKMDASYTCGSLATYLSNFNRLNAPSPDEISKLVDYLESNYSSSDDKSEEVVARFLSSLWWKFDYKGRAFSGILRNYESKHPTSCVGERIRNYAKFDR